MNYIQMAISNTSSCFLQLNERCFSPKPYARSLQLRNTIIAEPEASFHEDISVNDFIPLLQKCRREKNIVHARLLHKQIKESGMEGDKEVGNYIVPMYVECGSMSDARDVYDRLPYRNEYSVTSLIQGYTQCGECQQAFDVFKNMSSDALSANKHTFLAVLKTCIRLQYVHRCYEVHALIIMTGYDTDMFIGSALIDMYVKCSRLQEARVVFLSLSVRNTVSWTTLISGYVENGQNEEALNLLNQMQMESVPLDIITFGCGLKASSSAGFVDEGRIIHSHIVMSGYEIECLIGNTLVDMYAIFGLLSEAEYVFERIGERDVVTWTTLISSYVDNGFNEDALICFRDMKKDNVSPNEFTYSCALKACCNLGAFHSGRELHVEISQEGYEKDSFLSASLIGLYTEWGSLEEAQEVFNDIQFKDIVVWTELIRGYVEYGFEDKALVCFFEMRQQDVHPDAGTYTCMLKACSRLHNVDFGHELHVHIVVDALENNRILRSALIDMYAKCGLLVEAQAVLDELRFPCLICWTALISGYLEEGFAQEAVDCFKEMETINLCPDEITFICILKACGILKSLQQGRYLHDQILKRGLEMYSSVGNVLVDMYSKCGSCSEAEKLFNELHRPDVISWTAMITAYTQKGLEEEALNSFQKMMLGGISPDLFAWNTIFSIFAGRSDKDNAFRVHALLQGQGLMPNTVIFLNALQVCTLIASLEAGKRIHAQINAAGLVNTELVLMNALIDFYGHCATIKECLEVFDAMNVKDKVTWNTLIASCARQGEPELACYMFERMKEEGIEPEDVTFVSILSLCSHSGLVEQGLMYFETMSNDYGIIPNVEHHNCLIDLLGRAGRLDDIALLLRRHFFEPNIVTWSTVLRACYQWGNIQLGRRAFEKTIALDEVNFPALMIMRNMYINA